MTTGSIYRFPLIEHSVESVFLLILILGAGAVLLGDLVAATAAKRLEISYAWYVPFSFALYFALGAVTVNLLSLAHAVAAGVVIGCIDGTAGSLIAHRVGVLGWERTPGPRQLLSAAVWIALMCGMLTFSGGALASAGLF